MLLIIFFKPLPDHFFIFPILLLNQFCNFSWSDKRLSQTKSILILNIFFNPLPDHFFYFSYPLTESILQFQLIWLKVNLKQINFYLNYLPFFLTRVFNGYVSHNFGTSCKFQRELLLNYYWFKLDQLIYFKYYM